MSRFVLLEGEAVAFSDGCALDQGEAVIEYLPDRQWTVRLLGAECGAGHTEDQPIGGFFTPEATTASTGMASADRARIEAAGVTA